MYVTYDALVKSINLKVDDKINPVFKSQRESLVVLSYGEMTMYNKINLPTNHNTFSLLKALKN